MTFTNPLRHSLKSISRNQTSIISQYKNCQMKKRTFEILISELERREAINWNIWKHRGTIFLNNQRATYMHTNQRNKNQPTAAAAAAFVWPVYRRFICTHEYVHSQTTTHSHMHVHWPIYKLLRSPHHETVNATTYISNISMLSCLFHYFKFFLKPSDYISKR